MAEEDPKLEARWAAWLIARNRRGTLGSLSLCAPLYPLFGVLDYLVAPREWLWLLWGVRALITLITFAMFPIVKGPLFDRHPNLLSAAYQVLIGWGISLMTVFLGGLSSAYYAGLSLVMLG